MAENNEQLTIDGDNYAIHPLSNGAAYIEGPHTKLRLSYDDFKRLTKTLGKYFVDRKKCECGGRTTTCAGC